MILPTTRIRKETKPVGPWLELMPGPVLVKWLEILFYGTDESQMQTRECWLFPWSYPQ